MKNINWQLISEAVEFYKSHGFEYIETPWIVPTDVMQITCPDFDKMRELNNGYSGMVGSAEQGFLSLAMKDQLPKVNYVSAGPCFRIENYDELHQSQFFKVELFVRCDTDRSAFIAAKELRNRAHKFMNYVPDVVYTDEGSDLEINGIEVGSYGARYHENVGWWAYGTGLAEPRYTQALSV
jgi:seryl-tRNA synthetase